MIFGLPNFAQEVFAGSARKAIETFLWYEICTPISNWAGVNMNTSSWSAVNSATNSWTGITDNASSWTNVNSASSDWVDIPPGDTSIKRC